MNHFASSRDELVVLGPNIREQFSIIADMPQDIEVQLPGITDFIARLSSLESPACRVWVEIGVVLVLIGWSGGGGLFNCSVLFLSSWFTFFSNLLVLWLSFGSCWVAIPSVVSLFSAVEVFFIVFGFLRLLAAVCSLFCHHCQVYDLASGLFCHIGGFGEGDNLLNFFKIFVAGMQEGRGGHLKVVVQGVKGYNKCYAVSDRAIFRDCRLKVLHELLHLCKYSGGFFFISKWLHNSRIVGKLFGDWLYNALAYLGADTS